MDMAQRIKERRILIGLTQEELGKKLGLQKSAIAKYENGRVENIKRNVIADMAKILECSPCYLMGWDDELSSKNQPPIIEYYNMLNDIGQEEASKRVKELTYIPEYTAEINTVNKQTNMEISNEYSLIPYPYFTNVSEAKEFLTEHKIAAFNGIDTSSDEEIIKTANITKTAMVNAGGYLYEERKINKRQV